MSNNLFSIADKIIVVTGGLGQLGEQWVGVLASAGARVAVLDARVGVEGEIVGLGGGSVLHVRCEVDKGRDVRHALSVIVNTWGEVPDGLVNAAAVDVPPVNNPLDHQDGSFEHYGEEAWDRMAEINVKGTWLCCRTFGGCMALGGRGSIVNVGSIYGQLSPDQRVYGGDWTKPLAYTATKSALYGVTRWLATYWAKVGVRVNILTPGGVANDQEAGFVERYCQRVPMGRMADQSDYDGALLYLLSDASRYMTGADLVVDGGLTAW